MARSSVPRSILVPLDGSPFAEQALPWAMALARAGSSRLRLALVHRCFPAPVDRAGRRLFVRMELAVRKSERDYVRGIASRARAEGLRVSTAMLEEPVGPALARYTRDIGLDLVVMSTHGRGPLQRAWLGSVADYLARTLEVPLLLVRPRESDQPIGEPSAAEILVPLDGSPLGEAALRPAAAVAGLLGAELSLLQVVAPVEQLAAPPLAFPTGFDERITTERRNQAQDYLDRVAARLRETGVPAKGVAQLGGYPAEAILEAARAPGVGMIALATRGHGGLRRVALGSVADKLIRAAELPVLLVRPRGRRKTD